ncbi:C2 calcium/lipid-binding plant phosphoribosyltransferase family protein [Actinidia rufa]|uniref:C2 calcium/lipid-binding plant phosphoribosyltransferase family protein n=1 Tax=Actinidia rufa TaxID=165716 RepID=A0A7J0F1H0_9ERIC|nr:C2 calcium/lipid-binding plant phosphoribosyltransferase family protein [Actinidia rufa]
MSNLKLGVEVVSAHNLMPKDGQGSSSSFVELHFDHQKFRTTIKEKDLNPVWNETFYFNISDPNNLSDQTLDAYVYNNIKETHSKSFLGKVRITGTSFVPYSDAVILHYPLEKRGLFSRVRGELGLKVFITGDPSVRSSNPLPAMETFVNSNSYSTPAQAPAQQLPDFVPNPFSNKKAETRHTFHHLPNTNNPPQQYQRAASVVQPSMKYGVDEMRAEPQAPRIMRMYSGLSAQPLEYAVKETSPFLGGGQVVGGRVIRADKPANTYDLVEQMQYLFVRVVKARDLPTMDVSGSLDPYVEVKVGNYKGITRHFEKQKNPEWNAVFAFSKERMQSSVLEVVVKDKDLVKDDFVGIVRFDLNEIPTRVPPDSPLAPEWYRLENKNGEKKNGELMLAVWIGTQADEAFPDAWHSDAVSPVDTSMASTYIHSKVYHAPRLWYVRVNVIEAQDLVVSERTRFPDVYVKAFIGNQVLKTKPIQARTMTAFWNEDLMFVAAEPFEDHLILTVEDRVGPNKDEVLGKVIIPLNAVERRADDRIVHSRWFNLQKPSSDNVEQPKKDKDKFASRLHLRVCLDGGYHVLDESTQYSSDLRPTAKQLWKPSIGILELGILNVDALHPTKTREGRGLWNYRYRAKYPPHMNTRISYAEAVHPDELDEEFDTFPTSRGADLVRMRYDRLRSVAGRIQTVVGDVATQGERFQALLSWRDPRATTIFITFCLVAAIVLYATPFQVLAVVGGFYVMRHPRFRHRLPAIPLNFFRRLPARTDSML